MCGCMLMHGSMENEEHSNSNPQTGVASTGKFMTNSIGNCAQCSYPLQSGYIYCPNCGKSLQTAKCPACGQRTNGSWSACAYCGSPLGEKQANFSR